MLSYQHAYHAGNLADLHKHALLASMLAYLVRKPKPLSYLETHSGRALYDLSGEQAATTGEAASGITRALAEGWLPQDHPLLAIIKATREKWGAAAYPGSPLIADTLLRGDDRLNLAELHPAEAEALEATMDGRARVHREDGFVMANRLCPPEPRRGMLLIDPSWEVKADYERMPDFIQRIARKWNVGVIALWYPILNDGRHAAMLRALSANHPEALRSEVRFPAARKGHRMVGSGMFVINAPWGTDKAAAEIEAMFRALGTRSAPAH